MSGPSDKAVTKVAIALGGYVTPRQALEAAHDPALGLDRSVCLRDVVEALRDYDDGTNHDYAVAASFIKREFGGGS